MLRPYGWTSSDAPDERELKECGDTFVDEVRRAHVVIGALVRPVHGARAPGSTKSFGNTGGCTCDAVPKPVVSLTKAPSRGKVAKVFGTKFTSQKSIGLYSMSNSRGQETIM